MGSLRAMFKSRSLIASFALVCLVLAACTSGRRRGGVMTDGGGLPDATIGIPDAGPVDCTSIPPAGAEYNPCCPALGNDACSVDLICAYLDDRDIPLCVSKLERGIRCTGDSQCFSGYVCRPNDEGVPRCQQPAGSVGRGSFCGNDSECMRGLRCITDPSGSRVCAPADGSCLDDSECSIGSGPDPASTVLARCSYDVGGPCRSATPNNVGDEGTCVYAVRGTCAVCGDATCTDTGIGGYVACGSGTVCVEEFLP